MKNKIYQYLLSLVLGLLAMQISAQTYPNKPTSLLVPQTAGGTNDIVARLVAPAFGEGHGSS
jgi:tripartite-type tricarboxylate transporter receptor subunit TctC